jgi:hypothetical protein
MTSIPIPVSGIETVPPGAARAGIGFSLDDVARFEGLMQRQGVPMPTASETARPSAVHTGATSFAQSLLNSDTMRTFFNPIGRINQAPELLLASSERVAEAGEFAPGAMLMTMVQIQKFSFECQLTSSVANRASDGVQELFRQQA